MTVNEIMKKVGSEKAHEFFKLHWMMEHGFTIMDIMSELQDMQYGDPEDSDRISTPITDLYKEWEAEHGFGGALWPCFEEFLDSEYKEVQQNENKSGGYMLTADEADRIAHIAAEMDVGEETDQYLIWEATDDDETFTLVSVNNNGNGFTVFVTYRESGQSDVDIESCDRNCRVLSELLRNIAEASAQNYKKEDK